MDNLTKTIIPIAALHFGLFYVATQSPSNKSEPNHPKKSVALKENTNAKSDFPYIESRLHPIPFFEPQNQLHTYAVWRSHAITDPTPKWDLASLRTFLGTQNIMYPDTDSAEFDLALTTRFYPPIESLKLGFGVCDEFALLALYGLIQIPQIQQTYLGMVSDDRPLGHAFTIFKINNYWGYSSNDEVSEPIFPTPQAAIDNMLLEFPFDPSTSYFFFRKVNTLGPWTYDITAAEKLSPNKSIAINTLESIIETDKEF